MQIFVLLLARVALYFTIVSVPFFFIYLSMRIGQDRLYRSMFGRSLLEELTEEQKQQ